MVTNGSEFGGLIPYFHKDEQGNIISEEISGREYMVYNETIVLSDLPDMRYGLKITHNNEQLIRVKNKMAKSLAEDEYLIDENTGFIFFNPVLNGKIVYIDTYYGRGCWLVPATRVATDILNVDGDVVNYKTFEDFVRQVKLYRYIGEYSSREQYSINNQVLYNGTTYSAIKDVPVNTPPPNTEYWRVLASGYGFVEEYDNKKDYFEKDCVKYGHAVYLCIKNSSGGILPTNTEHWIELVSVQSIFDQWIGADGNAGLKKDIIDTINNANDAMSDILGQWNGTETVDGLKHDVLEATENATNVVNEWNGTDTIQSLKQNVLDVKAETEEATENTLSKLDELSKFVFTNTYDASLSYEKHNFVFYEGSTYVSLQDNVIDKTPPLSPDYWQETASGIWFKGVYDSSAQYFPHNYVVNENKSGIYLCLKQCSGVALTDMEYWSSVIDVQSVIDQLLLLQIPDNSITMNKLDADLQGKITAYLEDGTVTLTNTLAYPFNNSEQTIALTIERDNTKYQIYTEVVGDTSNVGHVVVYDKQNNGFKIYYTGSAPAVNIKYQITGGMD